MPRCGTVRTRRSPRRPSGSAAPGPTWRASCAGWTRPGPRRDEPHGGTLPSLLIAGMLAVRPVFQVLFRAVLLVGLLGALRLVFGLGEVLDDDAVHDLVALGRVGLLVRVECSSAPEPFPRLVPAAGVEQSVGVGVEQPRRPGPAHTVGEFGHLQHGDPGLRPPLVPAYPGLNDEQFELRGAVQFPAVRVVDQRQRPVRPAQCPLRVGHQGQVADPSGEPAGGPQLCQGVGPPACPVGGHPGRFAHHADARRELAGLDRVLERPVGIILNGRGHQPPRHSICQLPRQRPQFGACLRIQLVRGDLLGQVLPRPPNLPRAGPPVLPAGPGVPPVPRRSRSFPAVPAPRPRTAVTVTVPLAPRPRPAVTLAARLAPRPRPAVTLAARLAPRPRPAVALAVLFTSRRASSAPGPAIVPARIPAGPPSWPGGPAARYAGALFLVADSPWPGRTPTRRSAASSGRIRIPAPAEARCPATRRLASRIAPGTARPPTGRPALVPLRLTLTPPSEP